MFNLIPYNRSNEGSLFSFFDNFERSFFGDTMSDMRHFRTDIVDKGDHFELSAELPGFQKEDIRIDLDNDVLTISARHEENTEENKDNYIRRERRFGTFSRSFDVSGIQADTIKAAYKDGVLCLEMPKRQPAQLPPSRQIQIQ